MQQEKRDPFAQYRGSPLNAIGGIVGAVVGVGLSRYAGPNLWIPGGATILLLLIFAKTPLKPKSFLGAISVTLGHVIWFAASGAMLGQWAPVVLDIALLTLGVLWLWLAPSLVAALYLGLVQAASLVINASSLLAAAPASPAHRALTVHCVWRLLALICLAVGYLNLRKARVREATMVPANETTTIDS